MSNELLNGLFALGGALAGAIASGIFAIYIARRSKEKSEITLLATKPTQLIVIGDEVNDDVKITVSGEEVKSLYMMDFKVLNSGNIPQETIEIPFSVTVDGKIINANFLQANHYIENPDDAISIIHDNKIVLKSNFLNPNEQVSTRVLFSRKPKGWSSEFRKVGTNILTKDDLEGRVPDVILRSFYEAISRSWFMDAYFKALLPQYREFKKSQSDD